MSEEEWDGRISSMRVSPTAFPELFEELKKTAHRDRIRRFCSLASMALFAIKYTDCDKKTKPTQDNVNEPKANKENLSIKDAFLENLDKLS